MTLPFNLGTLDWGDWLMGLWAAFVGGGASAVTSGFVVAMNDPEHYNLKTGQFYSLVASVFLMSGLVSAMAFLRNKPTPTKTTTTVVKQTETPEGQVTTTAQQKVVENPAPAAPKP